MFYSHGHLFVAVGNLLPFVIMGLFCKISFLVQKTTFDPLGVLWNCLLTLESIVYLGWQSCREFFTEVVHEDHAVKSVQHGTSRPTQKGCFISLQEPEKNFERQQRKNQCAQHNLGMCVEQLQKNAMQKMRMWKTRNMTFQENSLKMIVDTESWVNNHPLSYQAKPHHGQEKFPKVLLRLAMEGTPVARPRFRINFATRALFLHYSRIETQVLL